MNTGTSKNEYISKAISAVGLSVLAALCEVSYQAVRKWERAGRLPRTEWTGETSYAPKIIQACAAHGYAVTREQLLTIPPKPPEAEEVSATPAATLAVQEAMF